MFEYMPLGACINDKGTQNKIFCVHGGIGSSFSKIEDIEKITRPLKIKLGEVTDTVQQMAMDILWSDPSPSEDVMGLSWN